MMTQNYPEYHGHLKELVRGLSKELPGPMAGFAQLHKQAMTDGALSTKVKELMALSIGIHACCAGCIAFHVQGALKAGATRQEVLETIGVAVMMGGGPAWVYAAEAYEALGQFEKANVQ